MIFFILKQQNQLNKINSEIKTTFSAYLTSMKLKNHLLQHIRELDENNNCAVRLRYATQRRNWHTFVIGMPPL